MVLHNGTPGMFVYDILVEIIVMIKQDSVRVMWDFTGKRKVGHISVNRVFDSSSELKTIL